MFRYALPVLSAIRHQFPVPYLRLHKHRANRPLPQVYSQTKDYIYNEVTDDYNAGFTGALAGLYAFYGADGKENADDNHVIENFDMSVNKPGAKDDSLGVYVTAGKAQETDEMCIRDSFQTECRDTFYKDRQYR